ncbi:MAG: phosphate ABC transporter substrate-binding protein PstS [Caldimicrobium sp.]
MKKILFLLFVFITITALVSCKGKEEAPKGKGGKIINGAGATFPYPLYSVWASDYYKETGIRINYQSIGSGGGIRQIAERTVDFGASDMALKPEEVEEKKLLQFPTVIGGVVLSYNIPEIKEGKLVLDGETVCKIYLGEIKKWNDPKIKALNSNLDLPDKPITPVYRSDGSGTTAIFTHYLSDVCPKWAKEIGYGTSVNFRAGIGAKGNEGVANYVKRTPYTIGYVEYAYAIQNNMKVAYLKNKSGKVVSPSAESFKEAAKTSDLTAEKHFYAWMTNARGEGAWPIVGATYILLAKEKTEINKEVVKFFDWAYTKGDKRALELHYVPLPDEVKAKVRDYWKANGIY